MIERRKVDIIRDANGIDYTDSRGEGAATCDVVKMGAGNLGEERMQQFVWSVG